ncbi:MAG: glyoxalase [Lachnospiraceae bacterium]|nr:glyoxalase [Lachnospiraceae bacterium]
MYDDICVDTFLKNQLQLFPEPVAETEEEALYFLEDVCAVVCDNKKDVIRYMKDMLDVSGLSENEILAAEEVFHLPDGRFMIVEG